MFFCFFFYTKCLNRPFQQKSFLELIRGENSNQCILELIVSIHVLVISHGLLVILTIIFKVVLFVFLFCFDFNSSSSLLVCSTIVFVIMGVS